MTPSIRETQQYLYLSVKVDGLFDDKSLLPVLAGISYNNALLCSVYIANKPGRDPGIYVISIKTYYFMQPSLFCLLMQL